MKYIGDAGVRHIQPKELKYLSDADKVLVKALGGVVMAMCGYNEFDCVVLDGLMIDITNKPGAPIICRVSEGRVLYRGEIYSIEAWKATLEAISDMKKIVLTLNSEAIIVAPSPVYDINLSKTKNVHTEWKGYTSIRNTPADNTFALYPENTLFPTLKRLGEFQRKAVAIGN